MNLYVRVTRPDGSRRYVGPYGDRQAALVTLDAWREHMTRYACNIVSDADSADDIAKAQKAADKGRQYYPNGKVETR